MKNSHIKIYINKNIHILTYKIIKMQKDAKKKTTMT